MRLSVAKMSAAVAILDQMESDIKNCGIGAGGFQGGNQCARGGSGGSGGAKPPASGGSFRLGGSPGGKDSYNDRIEGTQAEANREVKRYEKAAKQAEAKLKAAEARRGKNAQVVKNLMTALNDVHAKKLDLMKQHAASQQRIAALKAKLNPPKKSAQSAIISKIDAELGTMKKQTDNLRRLTTIVEGISKKADSL